MPNVIVIRLIPENPIAGADFTGYLTGLVIKAEDIAYPVANGYIEFSDQPQAGSTITLNGTDWSFVNNNPTGNQTKIGDDLDATLVELASNLNQSLDGEIAKCNYVANTTDHRLEIRFKKAGTEGNNFMLATSANSKAEPSAKTLTGGGSAAVQRRYMGEAKRITSDSNGQGEPLNRIIQHLKPPTLVTVNDPSTGAPIEDPLTGKPITVLGPPEWLAVATAVIEIPALPEYQYNDVVLNIERNGEKINERRLHYNAPSAQISALDAHDAYSGLAASLYVALPPPARDLDSNIAHIDLPDDGTPPNFTELKEAIRKVLQGDPDGAINFADDAVLDDFLAQLSPQQCRHIAYEIVWNRQTDPLPVPQSLEDMYTNSKDDSNPVEQARKRFEADLLRYYSTHAVEAERLSKYVFSLSAAIDCARKSTETTRVGFRFPVLAEGTGDAAKIKETEVVLTNP